jgi:nicotinamidase-related amidase
MKELNIEITKTALVVIDLQKGIVDRETFPHASRDVVKKAALIAGGFRRNKMPVFLVRVNMSADGGDRLSPITDQPITNHTLAADWAEIVPEMGPKPDDFVITKHQWGAFYGTELDLQLRRRGITTIVLCGIATNIGVESTARFAFEYGFNQIFVEDAMASISPDEHEFTVSKTFSRMGLVRNTQDVLKALDS